MLIKHWRLFTRDEDIIEIEQNEEARRAVAKMRPPINPAYVMCQIKCLLTRQN